MRQPCSEETVWTVLNAPVETSSNVLSQELGLCRDTVRKIRLGVTFSNLFPEIERLTQEQMSQNCAKCKFFKRESKRRFQCDFGYPEAVNFRFARGCGAYLEDDQ
jgi:hypothetical protein